VRGSDGRDVVGEQIVDERAFGRGRADPSQLPTFSQDGSPPLDGAAERFCLDEDDTGEARSQLR
jgi:hypothetical protein